MLGLPGRRLRPISRHAPLLLSLATYTVIAVIGWWNAWSMGPREFAQLGGSGDQAISMWFLAWAPYSVLHLQNPFFSNLANHPYGVNLLDNNPALALGYLMAPVTWFGGPVLSFNIIATLAPVVSAAAAYALIRRFTEWRLAAFVGGLLYGFSPYIVGQGTGHIFVEFVPLPPLILLVLHDIVVRQRGRPIPKGALLAAMLVVQFFISSEVMVDTLLIGAAGVIIVALTSRRSIRDHLAFAVKGIGSAIPIVVVALAYPMWFALDGPAHVVGLLQPTPEAYRADLLGIIVPDHLMRFAPSALRTLADKFSGNTTENGSYLGLPLVAVGTATAVWLRRNLVVLVAAIMGLMAFILSLGSRLTIANHVLTNVPLPEALLAKTPLLQNVIPARLSVFVPLFTALVLGVALDKLRGAPTRGGRRWVSGALPLVLVCACLLPLVPNWPYPMERIQVPMLFTPTTVDAIQPNSVVLMYPYPNGSFAQGDLWQASRLFPFKIAGGSFVLPQPITGKVGNGRPSLINSVMSDLAAGIWPGEDQPLRAELDRLLRSWDVTTVVAVPGSAHFPEAVSYLNWMLGKPPTKVAGADVWYHLPVTSAPSSMTGHDGGAGHRAGGGRSRGVIRS